MRTILRFVTAAVLISARLVLADARQYGGRYTEERLRNARANCEKYDWAKANRAQAVKDAERWVTRSDEELWAMVPGQDLPRAIDVTMDRRVSGADKRLGCLKCGDKIFRYGNYPYTPDIDGKPWKLTCPSCGAVFPTNDFGKYYASGIDERGLFNPKKADRSLLFNAEHPDPADPLHGFGVDDGYGYVDKNGREHRFVAYYAWQYWRHVIGGLQSLSNAYVYTGDQRYAHKAAVLLDRIADVYPDMDWKPYAERGYYHSDGNSPLGKIEGRIWETQTGRNLAESYDRIISGTVGDDALYSFLAHRAKTYKTPRTKGTRDLLLANVDEGVLRTLFRSVTSGQVYGNEGMHQLMIAQAAMALNTEPETGQWLDWIFDPRGGAIPGFIVSKLDRDGVSIEGAPGYALMWGQLMGDLAVRLAEYPGYTKHNIFRDFPQFRATYTAGWRMSALGVATPNIGDTGETGRMQRQGTPEFMATGYRFTKDPEIAIAAYRVNGNSAAGLGRDVFSADPDALPKEIDRVARSAGPRAVPASELMTGFGLATLESGRDPYAIAVPCYYGRSMYHAHQDHLNFDLLAFGRWLAPDLGYPEFATNWPSRNEWNNAALSHNVVVMDGEDQPEDYGGHLRIFKSLPGVQAVEVDAKSAYPGKAKEYSRTLVTVETPAGPSYVVDVFRVAGGRDHLMSFHGPPGDVAATGIELSPQPSGTYAGSDVAFAAPRKGFPAGYQYLYNVRRASSPPANFVLDWHADPKYRGLKLNDVHLRYHVLTQCADVALADGDPAQNKPDNPRRITYALLHRTGGEGLASEYVSVIEPYRGTPFIRSVELDEGNVTRLNLVDGTVDTVIINGSARATRLADGTSFDGRIAVVRRIGTRVSTAVMISGTSLDAGEAHLKSDPVYSGKVVRMNRQLAGGGLIWTDADLPTDGSLAGQPILIRNDNERDACYTIRAVTRDGGLTRIDCGPVSFVRSYAGKTIKLRGQTVPSDYSEGFLYDFDEGAPFTIPTHAVWTRPAK